MFYFYSVIYLISYWKKYLNMYLSILYVYKYWNEY